MRRRRLQPLQAEKGAAGIEYLEYLSGCAAFLRGAIIGGAFGFLMGDLLRSSLEQPVGPVMAGEVQRYHFVMFLGRTGVAWGILLGGLIATIRWESATGAVEE